MTVIDDIAEPTIASLQAQLAQQQLLLNENQKVINAYEDQVAWLQERLKLLESKRYQPVLMRLILAILLWSLYQAIAKYLVVSQVQFCTGTFLIFKPKSFDSKDLVQLFLEGRWILKTGKLCVK